MRGRRSLVWAVLAVALVAALFVGSRSGGPPPTAAERAHQIATTVRCPQCEGQSAANSDAPSAVSLREDIARRVAEGQSDDEIRQAYVRSFGPHIVLNPPRSGVAGLVWVLPVAAFVVAVAGLVVAFRRWSADTAAAPTADDRLLVERARGEGPA